MNIYVNIIRCNSNCAISQKQGRIIGQSNQVSICFNSSRIRKISFDKRDKELKLYYTIHVIYRQRQLTLVCNF